MSLQSWKEEFYPVPADDESITDTAEAVRHSLQKWKGLSERQRAKHGVSVTSHGRLHESGDPCMRIFFVDASTCALCEQHFDSSGGTCSTCPLYLLRDGVPCDKLNPALDGEESPFVMWTDHNNPLPMITLLQQADAGVLAAKMLDTIADVVDNTPTDNTEKQPMSVQCPHCGGEFNLEVKLTVPVLPECKPRAVLPVEMPTASTPKFAVHTDAGKLRRAVHRVGYTDAAKTGTIFNDKRDFGRRLKMWPRLGQAFAAVERDALKNAITAEFGDRVLRVSISGGEILVYLNS